MADLGRSRKDLPRRATRLGLLLGVVAAAPAGCQEVGSGAVMTSSMYADLSVLGMGDGTSRVRAALRIGSMQSATFVELQPGDTLTAVSGAKTQKLERTADPLGGSKRCGARGLKPFDHFIRKPCNRAIVDQIAKPSSHWPSLPESRPPDGRHRARNAHPR